MTPTPEDIQAAIAVADRTQHLREAQRNDVDLAVLTLAVAYRSLLYESRGLVGVLRSMTQDNGEPTGTYALRCSLMANHALGMWREKYPESQ